MDNGKNWKGIELGEGEGKARRLYFNFCFSKAAQA